MREQEDCDCCYHALLQAKHAAVYPMVIVPLSQILIYAVGKALQRIDVKELYLAAKG
jgi:hypothetical protein